MATIRAWSGWATSANIQSTALTSILYLCGCLASSIMGITFVLFLAMFIRSRPLLWENSTANTRPSSPTTSDTWLTVVPDAAPRYKTLAPGFMCMLSTPALDKQQLVDHFILQKRQNFPRNQKNMHTYISQWWPPIHQHGPSVYNQKHTPGDNWLLCTTPTHTVHQTYLPL